MMVLDEKSTKVITICRGAMFVANNMEKVVEIFHLTQKMSEEKSLRFIFWGP